MLIVSLSFWKGIGIDMSYKFYSLKNILSKNAQYNIIIGERSNGKTYAVEEYGIKNYLATGETMALIRRWKEDYKGKRGQHMFDALVENDVVKKYSKGEFDTITYYNNQWWLAKYDSDTNTYIKDSKPFCYGFALSDVEHDKSISFPTVTTIMFDEFLTRSYYLQDEFIIFMNVLSTIIRQRDNVKIFMLGNTVNKFCPYFQELGLTHIRNMKQGTIDVYSYGDSKLHVAVEYCDNLNRKSKASDIYFAFNNPRLEMIKTGAWELAIYNHLPFKYRPVDIMYTFFIVFNDNIVQCEIIYKNGDLIIYCHLKTTELQVKDTDIIYTLDADSRPNFRKTFLKPIDNIDKRILLLFRSNKVFYQSNDVGEIVRNFLMQSNGGIIS